MLSLILVTSCRHLGIKIDYARLKHYNFLIYKSEPHFLTRWAWLASQESSFWFVCSDCWLTSETLDRLSSSPFISLCQRGSLLPHAILFRAHQPPFYLNSRDNHVDSFQRVRMASEFYVRYYVGHKGKFGHEFLEFEFRPDGKLES